jgi:hypothetical protein
MLLVSAALPSHLTLKFAHRSADTNCMDTIAKHEAQTAEIRELVTRLPWQGTSQQHRDDLALVVAELATSAAPDTPEPAPITPLMQLELPAHARGLTIATTGYPGAGKDVASDYMQLIYQPVRRLAFSDVMIIEANAWLASEPLVAHHRIHTGNKSHLPYRRLLQLSAMLRREEQAHYWTEKLGAIVREWQAEPDRPFISMAGARAETDLELVTGELGGQKGRVYRPNDPNPLPDAPIERQLDHLTPADYDFTFLNDREGDIPHYLRQVDNRWGWGDTYRSRYERLAARVLGAIHWRLTWGQERRVQLANSVLGLPRLKRIRFALVRAGVWPSR